LSSWNKVISRFSNSHGIYLSSFRAIKHSYSLSIETIPVCNFSVTSCCEDLWFIWVIKNLFKHCWLK
jgi:hypothetical protein